MYDPTTLEEKWQAYWAARGINEPDMDGAPNPFFNLMMFPYPSAEGLHVGNLYAFTGADFHARYQRLRGRNVFEPIGFDAFGIHSENYALKVGEHPMDLIPRSIANFTRQLGRSGIMYDWSHTVDTTDPAYYRWTQWIFLQLYKSGLAVKKEAPVNWTRIELDIESPEQMTEALKQLIQTKEIYDIALQRIPMKRHAQPSEIVGAALYLASDASSYVTGSCITVDGGMMT